MSGRRRGLARHATRAVRHAMHAVAVIECSRDAGKLLARGGELGSDEGRGPCS